MSDIQRYASRGPYRRTEKATNQGDHTPGEKRYGSKLKDADVLHMRALRAAGEKTIAIAALYPQVTRQTVEAILRREKWKHLP